LISSAVVTEALALANPAVPIVFQYSTLMIPALNNAAPVETSFPLLSNAVVKVASPLTNNAVVAVVSPPHNLAVVIP
jgi:hypothetical protein